MLNIVCVKWGTLYGPEYVNILYDMVRRNLKEGTIGRFHCFTDDPEGLDKGIIPRVLPDNLSGWWNKLYLFKAGLFEDGDRVIYLDLDTVITGSLDEVFSYNGDFAILRDFYRPEGYGSAIMSWIAGSCKDIWNGYVLAGFPVLDGGDQAWIERSRFLPEIWQDLYHNAFVSYKAHCNQGIPKGAKVVSFHGVPKPSDIKEGWVPRIWEIGGGSSLEIEVEANTKIDAVKANIRQSLESGIQTLSEVVPAHDKCAVMVGGGPSINGLLHEIKMRSAGGQHVIALNNSRRTLIENNITVHKQVMLDARAENAAFIPDAAYDIERLYASQCHSSVVSNASCLWHALIPDIVDDFNDKNMFWVGSGTTVGIRAILLMYVLGYRSFHIYGYDSSYIDDQGHAYKQPLNDGENVIDVCAGGRDFKAAPWMVTQTEEFLRLMEFLTKEGCEFAIHGDGLLPHAVKTMLTPINNYGEIDEINGIYWPSNDVEGRYYITSALSDLDHIMRFVDGRKVCVQAGGNVGLWPKEFSKHFDAVYTFEPDPVNFRCLTLNCPEHNIVKMQAVLGTDYALVDISKSEKNCGAHAVGGEGIIPTICIDDLGLTACDLIQLDVEGYERIALDGAQQTIKKFSPVITIEENGLSEKYGTKSGEITEWLSHFGYRLVSRIHRDLIFKKENNV